MEGWTVGGFFFERSLFFKKVIFCYKCINGPWRLSFNSHAKLSVNSTTGIIDGTVDTHCKRATNDDDFLTQNVISTQLSVHLENNSTLPLFDEWFPFIVLLMHSLFVSTDMTCLGKQCVIEN